MFAPSFQPRFSRVAGSNTDRQRSAASISKSACSAAARLLVPGMLQTAIRRARAASRSMVLTPTPIFWISLRFGAPAMAAAVTGLSTCHSTSASPIRAANLSSSPSEQTETVNPSAVKAVRRFNRAGLVS